MSNLRFEQYTCLRMRAPARRRLSHKRNPLGDNENTGSEAGKNVRLLRIQTVMTAKQLPSADVVPSEDDVKYESVYRTGDQLQKGNSNGRSDALAVMPFVRLFAIPQYQWALEMICHRKVKARLIYKKLKSSSCLHSPPPQMVVQSVLDESLCLARSLSGLPD